MHLFGGITLAIKAGFIERSRGIGDEVRFKAIVTRHAGSRGHAVVGGQADNDQRANLVFRQVSL